MSDLNDWFLSLSAERQNALRENKWALAEAAFAAGKAARAQPAQAGQVLTDEEIDDAYEKARADYQRSRFAVRGQQLTAQDSPDWWFARVIESAVLARVARVPMTEAQIEAALREQTPEDQCRDFRAGIRAAERHHGIVGEKGGQHG